MRRRLALALLLAAAARGAALPPAADELHPGEPAEVYLAPGRATTVQLSSPRKVAAISMASPLVSYKYDKALNQLELTPASRFAGGETNLNLRIGPDVYVLVLKVVEDVRAQYLRRFVLSGDDREDDEEALAGTRPLRPDQVDLIAAARTLERAEVDPVFKASHPELRIEPLGRCMPWNGCLIALTEAAQFLDRDLLVFRVQWLNRTADALYLDSRQYGLLAGGRSIPIIARYQVGSGPVRYPGSLTTVYLAVQGYRLSRHNDWRLALPPEAEWIEQGLGRTGR